MSTLNSVQQFYAGKTVFITGGSGFMGKVLIEKLLYSCSDVRELIILMRPKRGKTAAQRVEDFAKLPVSSLSGEIYSPVSLTHPYVIDVQAHNGREARSDE